MQCIDWHQHKRFPEIEIIQLQVRRKIEKLFKDVPYFKLELHDFKRRTALLKDNLFAFMFDFLERRLHVEQRVTSFVNGTKHVGLESTCSSQNAIEVRKSVEQEVQADQQELKESVIFEVAEEIKKSPVQCEGIMYRALNGCSLKSYYYKLVGDQLFAYKKDSPHDLKTVLYVGHSSYIVPFVPKVQTSSNQPLYGLEVVSGKKSTQYFILEHDAYEAWREALTQAMGLSGLLVQHYEVLEKIGEGKFGKVLKAKDRLTQQQVAIKAVQKSKLTE